MNARQILAASAASAAALLLSSCAVDGYSYYGTGYYDGGGTYCAPSYGSTYYGNHRYSPSGYGSRYYSNGRYCPPSRPIIVVNDHHNHNNRPWSNRPWSGGGNNHGGGHNNNHWNGNPGGGHVSHGGGSGGHNSGSWSGNSGGGRHNQPASFEIPRGGRPDSGRSGGDSRPKEDHRSGGTLMDNRGSRRYGRD